MRYSSLCLAALLLAAPAHAEMPTANQLGMTAYTKLHLIDDFLHCAAYDKIAAECSAGTPTLADNYNQDSAKAAEAAIKLSMAENVQPDAFKRKVAEVDAQLRAEVQGNCQSQVLTQQYGQLCHDMTVDVAPRTVYWAERFQAERNAKPAQ